MNARIVATVTPVLAMTALLAAVPRPSRAEVIEEIVAKVNDDVITKSDLDTEEQGLLQELYRRYSGPELDAQVKTAKEGEKGQLETDISTLEAKVAKTEALTVELENLKANFAQYIKILPSPEIATQQRLMELVNDKSVKTTFGLERFDLKKEIAAAAARRTKTAFQEVEIALTAALG